LGEEDKQEEVSWFTLREEGEWYVRTAWSEID
jgi:hypothetical protein